MFNWLSTTWVELTRSLGQLPHAILLHGPKGIGKLNLATRFSGLLLCESPARNQPCGACDACRWFADGNHPDFRLVQPEAMAQEEAAQDGDTEETANSRKSKPSNEIRVDQVRALGDFLYVGSHRGARRVALVHPAEAMNANAANALLKGLEEPPPDAMFILVAHEPARLLPTVRSRCVSRAIARPSPADATAWLVAQGVERAERWLAFAGGAPLLALEFAKGANAAERARILDALGSGTGASLAINDRESLELLVEVLQKRAYDHAFGTLAGATRYGTGAKPSGPKSLAWLAFAREMGRIRALARRPLNAKLFATELLVRYGELAGY